MVDDLDLGPVDAVIVGQNAANPDAGGLRVGAHAELLPFKSDGFIAPRSEL